MPTTVADLAEHLDGARLRGDGAVVLRDATHDSRAVADGSLFCAIVGERADGHDHAAGAVEAGAAALLVERWLDDLDVPQVLVADSRAATGPAASLVHGEPSHDLVVVGTTGTNGKTTTSYLVEHAVAAAGRGTGVIGTIEARIHGQPLPGVRTTPEGTDLQRLLRTMHDRGVDVVAMEASSHGLALHRVDGIRFAVAVFLNLSQDHLDFHADMEEYFLAKARLFTPGLAQRGVVCVEDEWGRRLASKEAAVPVVTFGREERVGAAGADWLLTDLDARPEGSTFVLRGPSGAEHRLTTRLAGDVNAVNAAAAWLAAVEAGIEPADATAGIAACPGVPGRLQVVRPADHAAGRDAADVAVLVDYAHTPDAVEQAVRIVRGLGDEDARVLVVLGCGGDRDRAKRGPMGAAAAMADVAVLTSDNPRSEDPEAILDAMEEGARRAVDEGAPATLHRVVDREAAIALALREARPGDLVLVAGKGHETGQTFADRTVAFDDREVAARLLAERARGGGAAEPPTPSDPTSGAHP